MAGRIILGTDASDVVVIGWIAELRFDFVRASFAVPLIGLLLLSLSTTKTKAPAGSKHKPLVHYCCGVGAGGLDIAEEGTTATRTTLHSSFFLSGVLIFTFLPSSS